MLFLTYSKLIIYLIAHYKSKRRCKITTFW